MHGRDVFVQRAQRHEKTVEGTGGCFAFADLLSKLVQASSVSLDLTGEREAVSGVQITRVRIQTSQLTQLTLDVVIQVLETVQWWKVTVGVFFYMPKYDLKCFSGQIIINN